MKIAFFLFFLIILGLNGYSQASVLLKGKVHNQDKVGIPDVHILNLSTGIGTISTDSGSFEIPVALSDSLLFSSIQHGRNTVVISEPLYQSRNLTIGLRPVVNKLKTIVLHNLSGSLSSDFKKVPEDSLPQMNFSFHPQDIYKLSTTVSDDSNGPPNAAAFTDPLFLNGAKIGIPDKRYEVAKRSKKIRKLKLHFTNVLIADFGEDFFTSKLKITRDSIPLFLDFCERSNLFNLYHSGDKLAAISILLESQAPFKQQGPE